MQIPEFKHKLYEVTIFYYNHSEYHLSKEAYIGKSIDSTLYLHTSKKHWYQQTDLPAWNIFCDYMIKTWLQDKSYQ